MDGHNLSADEMNIFINSNEPKETFDLVKTVLTEKDLNNVSVVYREIDSEECLIIWPANKT